jgi:hypothetical protein
MPIARVQDGPAQLVIADPPIVEPLKQLQIEPNPLPPALIRAWHRVREDHLKCWFLTHDKPPAASAGTKW